MNRDALLLYLQRIKREAMNDLFWFVPHAICRFTVSWMQKGLSITRHRSRTHSETLVVSTGIRLVCSDMDRHGVVVLDDVLEVLGGNSFSEGNASVITFSCRLSFRISRRRRSSCCHLHDARTTSTFIEWTSTAICTFLQPVPREYLARLVVDQVHSAPSTQTTRLR